MEKQKITKALARFGLVGLLALTGCSKRIDFMDGSDLVQVEYGGLDEINCGGRIFIFVEKKDGTSITYDGGRAYPYKNVDPMLHSYKITLRGKKMFFQDPNPDAYRNFTNYIGMVEKIKQEEVNSALGKLEEVERK